MTISFFPVLAAASNPEPLFGNQLYALAAVLVGVTVLLFAVAGFGRWLASTHPEANAAPAAAPAAHATQPEASAVEAGPTAEVFAVIAAAVAATFGSKAHIASINSVPATDEDTPSARLQWSMEGRRQIYSSHKVR